MTTAAEPQLTTTTPGLTIASHPITYASIILDVPGTTRIKCPASSSWQDFLGFECRGGGVGQAQVHLLGPVP
ncbi:hypothetical protein GCM10009771_15290 [Nesterenkonia flava]